MKKRYWIKGGVIGVLFIVLPIILLIVLEKLLSIESPQWLVSFLEYNLWQAVSLLRLLNIDDGSSESMYGVLSIILLFYFVIGGILGYMFDFARKKFKTR